MEKQYIKQRNNEIIEVYHRLLSDKKISASHISLRRIADMIIHTEASGFFISNSQAMRYIKLMESGSLHLRRTIKYELMQDLYRAYKLAEQRYNRHYKSFIISKAIHTKAPRFYVSAQQVIRIITENS